MHYFKFGIINVLYKVQMGSLNQIGDDFLIKIVVYFKYSVKCYQNILLVFEARYEARQETFGLYPYPSANKSPLVLTQDQN